MPDSQPDSQPLGSEYRYGETAADAGLSAAR